MTLTITILGCGTSSGVPRIGNDWGDCDPADPRNARTRASVLVESTSTRILVDTGPDMRMQLLAANIGVVDAVIWTHDHADHSHGIDDIRQLAHASGQAVPGYAHAATLRSLKARFGYAFDGRAGYRPIIEGHELATKTNIGDICVETVDQPHGAIFSSGLKFTLNGKSFCYAVDCDTVTADMIRLYRQTDLLVVDALRVRPHPTHLDLDQSLAAIAAIQPAAALLTHMDQSMDYASLCGKLPPTVRPAYDGQQVVL